MPDGVYPVFIAVTVITLVATPFIMGLGRFADAIVGRRIWPAFLRGSRVDEKGKRG